MDSIKRIIPYIAAWAMMSAAYYVAATVILTIVANSSLSIAGMLVLFGLTLCILTVVIIYAMYYLFDGVGAGTFGMACLLLATTYFTVPEYVAHTGIEFGLMSEWVLIAFRNLWSWIGAFGDPQYALRSWAYIAIIQAGCALMITGFGINRIWKYCRDTMQLEEVLSGKGNNKTTARSADAKWATRKEILDTFSAPNGIVLGEYSDHQGAIPDFDPSKPQKWGKQGKGHLITMSPTTGNGHVLAISESSGFKTTGMVIPTILNYSIGPICVLDPKGDLYARTAGARRKMGFEPLVITAEEGLDPLKMLEPLLEDHPSILREMAANIIPANASASEEATFFRERAMDLLAPLLFIAIKQDDVSAPEFISNFLSMPHEKLLEAAEKIALNYSEPYISGPMARVAAVDVRGFESFIRTVSNKFAFAEYPDVKGFVEQPRDSTRHELVLKPKTDIYLNIPTSTLLQFSSIARLILASFLTAAKNTEQPENPSARRLFILDEAKGLGNMDILTVIRDEGRAVGLHLMLFYQSWTQFSGIWQGNAGAWEDSVEARILGATQISDRAQAMQENVGFDTYNYSTENTSTSTRGIEWIGTTQKGSHGQRKEAALMTKADISNLPRHACIIFTRSSRPIRATKAIYFTRNDMKDRVRRVEDVTDELLVSKTAKALRKNDEPDSVEVVEMPEPMLSSVELHNQVVRRKLYKRVDDTLANKTEDK